MKPSEELTAAALAQHKEDQLKLALDLIADCQKVLAEWIVPDSEISQFACLSELLELLDGPRSRALVGKPLPPA